MNSGAEVYLHSDLTEKIIGAAMAVHRELGPGLDEKIYENALCVELTMQLLSYTQQQQFQVFYKEQFVGKLITDLIVAGKVIIETKVASQITDLHIAQTISYLRITNLQVGLILNFKNPSLAFKRISNNYQKIIKSA
jgi:GxxExxY protein